MIVTNQLNRMYGEVSETILEMVIGIKIDEKSPAKTIGCTESLR